MNLIHLFQTQLTHSQCGQSLNFSSLDLNILYTQQIVWGTVGRIRVSHKAGFYSL